MAFIRYLLLKFATLVLVKEMIPTPQTLACFAINSVLKQTIRPTSTAMVNCSADLQHKGSCYGVDYCCRSDYDLRCDTGRAECTKGTNPVSLCSAFRSGGPECPSAPSPPPSPSPSPSPGGLPCAFMGCPKDNSNQGYQDMNDSWTQSMRNCIALAGEPCKGKCDLASTDPCSMTSECAECISQNGCPHAKDFLSCCQCKVDKSGWDGWKGTCFPTSYPEGCTTVGKPAKRPEKSNSCGVFLQKEFNVPCYQSSDSLYTYLTDQSLQDLWTRTSDATAGEDCQQGCESMDHPYFFSKNCQRCLMTDLRQQSETLPAQYRSWADCLACEQGENKENCGMCLPPTPAPKKKKFPWWGYLLIFGGIALGVIAVGSLVAYLVKKGNATSGPPAGEFVQV